MFQGHSEEQELEKLVNELLSLDHWQYNGKRDRKVYIFGDYCGKNNKKKNHLKKK